MPPPLPERYRLEVRIGSDEDVEQWLGADLNLDRPVLVRFLGPESSEERRAAFLGSVQSAAIVNHQHLATIFTAGTVPDGVFSISEWTGGMTLADRAPTPIDIQEFLPNAAGLADALAALHADGAVHGSIDPEAILYSVAHPAKLGSFGRRPRTLTTVDDVRALATVLETALTGSAGAPPSEVVDGLDRSVDAILAAARDGLLDARGLADRLAASPTPVEPEPPADSRRLVWGAAVLVGVAVLLVVAGRIFLVGPEGRVAVPDLPDRRAPAMTFPPPAVPERVPILEVGVVDPFGDESEGDARLSNLIDGDILTRWKTETYRDPLPLLKPGVGVEFHLGSAPALVELVGVTAGTSLSVAWDGADTADPAGWDVVSRLRSSGEAAQVELPEREGGRWIVWLEDLPEIEPGAFSAEVAEVRFLP